jgi:hypothetical protein
MRSRLEQTFNELDALPPFFRDKVKSVLKLFETMHKPNTYEIGHIFASKWFSGVAARAPARLFMGNLLQLVE